MTRRWWWISALLTAGACTSADPGIVKNDCPGTPKIVSLDQPGPFWSGLERIHFTVPDGTPSAIQVETFNPALGTWSGFPSSLLEQEDDDSYVASASITPVAETKDASFKLRVRALLDSCPPSDWATTEPFTVGDPVAGTSWRAHVEDGELAFFFFQPSVSLGVGTAVGPYSPAASGIDHTMQFHVDGTVDETWGFGVESAHPGDLYAGCKFSIHYVGQWRWLFTPFFRLVITGLAPAPTPLAGSTCTTPQIADLTINQAGFTASLQPSDIFPSIDYSRLIFQPPGKAIWQDNQEVSRLSQVVDVLSDTVGADRADLQASISFNSVAYTKQ